MSSLLAFTLFVMVTLVVKCHGRGNSIKQIIYDFDETISAEHMFHILSHIGGYTAAEQLKALEDSNEGTLTRMFGGKHRIKFLQNHFETLESRGIDLVIVSLGYKEVMTKALQRVDLLRYFDASNIYGRESLDDSAITLHRTNLSALKVMFIAHHLKLPSRQKLLVDNDQRTLQYALQRDVARIFDRQIINGLTESQTKAIEGYI